MLWMLRSEKKTCLLRHIRIFYDYELIKAWHREQIKCILLYKNKRPFQEGQKIK